MFIDTEKADYFESGSIEIFPSSNATDSGKITSEENLRDIVIRITDKNYVMRSNQHPKYNPKDAKNLDFHLSLNDDNNKITVSPGYANIHGYDILTYTEIELTNPTITGDLNIYGSLQFDGQGTPDGGHVLGDSSRVLIGKTIYYCHGFYITFGKQTDNLEDYQILLGTVHFENSKFTNLKENPNKYTRIDSSNIQITNNVFGSNNLHALVSELLDTFIMRDGSKAKNMNGKGGNFYGDLLGRNKNYISDTDYRIKVSLNEASKQEIEFKSSDQTDDKYKAIIGTDKIGPRLVLGKNQFRYTFDEEDGSLSITGDPISIESKTSIDNDFYINKSNFGLSTYNNSLIIGTHIYDSNVISGGALITTPTDNLISNQFSVNSNSIIQSFDGNTLLYSSTTGAKVKFDVDTILSKILIANTGENKYTQIYKDNLVTDFQNFKLTISNTLNGMIINPSENQTSIIKVGNDSTDYVDIKSTGEVQIKSSSSPSLKFMKNNNSGTISLDDINNCISVNKNLTVIGNIVGTRVFNSVYNDVAEFMEKNKDEIIEPGDLVCVREDEKYYKVSQPQDIHRIVGVCSSKDTYGYVLGGDGLDEDQKVPVGLAGRVYVKCTDFVKPGDDLVVDRNFFNVRKKHWDEKDAIIIGKAVSHSKDGLVYMLIR